MRRKNSYILTSSIIELGKSFPTTWQHIQLSNRRNSDGMQKLHHYFDKKKSSLKNFSFSEYYTNCFPS